MTDLGWRGFANSVRDTEARSLVYGGFSVTYNPYKIDYDAQEDAYVSNQYFGVKHPFDMLADGDIINLDSLTLE